MFIFQSACLQTMKGIDKKESVNQNKEYVKSALDIFKQVHCDQLEVKRARVCSHVVLTLFDWNDDNCQYIKSVEFACNRAKCTLMYA